MYASCSYITASKSGLTEGELEDILSLDERVLEELFEFYVPEGKQLWNCLDVVKGTNTIHFSNTFFAQCKKIILFFSVRRLPPILWRKIRRDLRDDFSEREADGSRVIVWAHKQVWIGAEYHRMPESLINCLCQGIKFT